MTYSISTIAPPSTSADPPSGPAARDVLYLNSLHKEYVSSGDHNPLLKFVWQIYTDSAGSGMYENVWAERVDSVGCMTQEALPFESEELQRDCRFVIDRAQFQVITHEHEEESEAPSIHDFREDGVTMDLARAEELCRKMRDKN